MKTMKLRRSKNKGWYEIKSECPICGHRGWCRINEEKTIVNCMRVPSDDYFDSHIGRQYRHYLSDVYPDTAFDDIEETSDIDKKPNDYLDAVYRTLLEEVSLSDFHHKELAERKFTNEQIRLREYRSLPTNDRHKTTKRVLNRLTDHDALLGVPGFYEKEGQFGSFWTMAGHSGMMIPSRSIYNEIIGFQIRVDQPPLEMNFKGDLGHIEGRIIKEHEKDESGFRKATCEIIKNGRRLVGELTEKIQQGIYDSATGKLVGSVTLTQGQKYYWWSSSNKNNGSSIGTPLPYHFSLPSSLMDKWNYNDTPDRLIDCSEVWVTEGGLKSDRAADVLLRPFFGTPGLNSFSLILEPLKALECKHVVIAPDADVTITPQVERALGQCAEFFAVNTDMKLSLAMWDLSLGKGIDNLVNNGYIPQVTTLVG